MRKERRKNERKQQLRWAVVIAAVYGVAAIALLVSVLRLGVLPGTYLAGIVVLLALVSFLLVKGIVSKKEGKGKIVCAAIACILALAMIAGTAMISGTLSFMKGIMAGSTQIHNYHVVVREDSEYEKLSDIEGKTVYVQRNEDAKLKKAKEELQKKTGVEFDTKDSINALAEALISEEVDILYMNAAYYEMALEEVDNFTEENTRILDTLNVVVENSASAKGANP